MIEVNERKCNDIFLFYNYKCPHCLEPIEVEYLRTPAPIFCDRCGKGLLNFIKIINNIGYRISFYRRNEPSK